MTEAMAEAQLRDEHVALRLGVSAGMVLKWRRDRAEPNRANYDALRAMLPEFAKRMDLAVVA